MTEEALGINSIGGPKPEPVLILPTALETDISFTYSVTDDAGTDVVAVVPKDAPALTLSKWDGEFELTISHNAVIASGAVTLAADSATSADTVIYQADDTAVQVYPIENGFEIEVIINAHPASNRFDFQMDGSEGLVFHKQPEAGQNFYPFPGASVWTDTHVFDDKGNILASRDYNIPGSIAIYSPKKHGKYKTGKIGHIYRPKAVDAQGTETWCTLEYADGVLTVVVPELFLSTAAYPVTVDPTLGYTTVGANSTILSAYLFGNHYQMSEDGTATAFHLWLATAVGSENSFKWTGAIYNSDGTTPSGKSQVGITADTAVAGNTTPTDQSASIGGSLVNGNWYWLGFEQDTQSTGHLITYYDNTGFASSYEVYTYTGGSLPDPMDTLTDATNAQISMYIDYDPVSSGPAFVPRAIMY
jgi:hypothetical protein